MGYTTQSNKALDIRVILRLLELARSTADEQPSFIANAYYKFDAAVVTALCGSLRGPEVFMLDLAGLRSYHHLGSDDVLPANPMKLGCKLPD